MGPIGAVALVTPEIIKGLKYLKKLGLAGKAAKYGKAAYKSKHFIPGLIGAGYLGSEALEAGAKAGERKLTKEELRLQRLMTKASAAATERSVKESQAKTKEYINALLKAKKEERKEARELQALESFTQSQDRQMALVFQAMQALSNKQMGASTTPAGGGMLGLMRGGF